MLWHPERVSTVQQKMLREKLDFLKPYIVRRRVDLYLVSLKRTQKCPKMLHPPDCRCLCSFSLFLQEGKFVDREEDDEALETEGSLDQEVGSSLGSPLDADVTGQDLDNEPQPAAPNPPPLHCPNPQPQVTDVVSLSCPHRHHDEGPGDQPDRAAAPSPPTRDVLSHFAEVMLADMRQIRDPMVLMRLRRDITDLVFKAAEEDARRRRVRAPPAAEEGAQPRPQRAHSQMTSYPWRQRFWKRKSKGSGCEAERRTQRWEEVKHGRRMSGSQILQPVQQGQAAECCESGSPAIIPASEIKREAEPHTVKIEEETLPLA